MKLSLQLAGWVQTTRARLVLLLSCSVVITILTICIAAEHVLSKHLRNLSGQWLMSISRPIALALAHGLREREREITLLSHVPLVMRQNLTGDGEVQLQALLEEVRQSDPFYSWIGVTDDKGVVRVATEHLLLGQDVRSQPWFAGGAVGTYVGEPYDPASKWQLLTASGNSTPPPFMDFAAPVRGKDSTFLGVISAHVNATWILDLLRRSSPVEATARGFEVMLVNKNVVLDPTGAVAKARSSLPALPETGKFGVVRWGDSASSDYLTGVLEIPSLISADLEWLLITRQPVDFALQPLKDMQFLVVLALALMTAMLLTSSYWAARYFSKPLEKLAKSARNVESTGKVNARDFEFGTLEFKQLGAALLHMTQALLEQRAALARANDELEERVQLRTQALQQSEQRYLAILEGQTEIIYRIDAQGRMNFANDAFCTLFKLNREEMLGKVWAPVVHPEDSLEREKLLRGVSSERPVVVTESRILAGDGSLRWCHFSNRALFDANGDLLEWQCVGRDITELKLAREQLQALVLEQDAMLDNDLISICKLRNRVIVWRNSAMEKIFGYAPGALQGHAVQDLYTDQRDFVEFCEQVNSALAAGKQFRLQRKMRKRNGDDVWIDINGMALSENECMLLMQDITTMKQYQEQVEHIAFHDHLSGLPNRLLLTDRMNQAFASCDRTGTQAAVCYMDLNGFKSVNDEYGHEMGDLVLRETSKRIQAQLRAIDTAARVGGDEFVLLLAPINDMAEVKLVIERVKSAIELPIELMPDTRVSISSAFGVAIYPQDGTVATELLRKADAAMYRNKDISGVGGNY